MSYKTTDRIERVKREVEEAVRKLKHQSDEIKFINRSIKKIIYRGLNDKVGFGKYRDKTWEEVIFEDPDYIQWAFDNIKNFFLDEEATQTWRNRMLAREADEADES